MLGIALTEVQEVLLGLVDIHEIAETSQPVRISILSLTKKNKELETSTKGRSLLSLLLLDENDFLHTGRITYHMAIQESITSIQRQESDLSQRRSKR